MVPVEPEHEHHRGRRLTLTELSLGLLDAMRRGGGDHSSVELTRNAKGDTQIRVHVRTGEADVDTAEQAAERATALYDELRERYPLAQPEPADS